MSSRFQCDNCLQRITVSDKLVARKIACPMCETRLIVPKPDPSRVFIEQDLEDALDRFKLTDWDRSCARKALELKLAPDRAVRKAIVAVRGAAQKRRKLSLNHELLRAGAISRDDDLALRQLLKDSRRADTEKFEECPNCFATIQATARRCRHCGQRLGDLLVVDMCPNCKREQPRTRTRELCRHCGADMRTGLKPGVRYPHCPRCGQLVKDSLSCPVCGTSLDRSPASIRREEMLKRAREWAGNHSLTLVGIALVIAGMYVWGNWEGISRKWAIRTKGEHGAALRERVRRFDTALQFDDRDTITAMLDPTLGRAAPGTDFGELSRAVRTSKRSPPSVDDRTRACILGVKVPSATVKRVDSIEHSQFNVDNMGGRAMVYTVVQGRLTSGKEKRLTVESSADLPTLLRGRRSSFSAHITWKWVLRRRTWYYRGPLPGPAEATADERR